MGSMIAIFVTISSSVLKIAVASLLISISAFIAMLISYAIRTWYEEAN
tara:strand:+ start:907 stop:1050 length:144 start_codon:yes stop_codon:yes gene_type:complete